MRPDHVVIVGASLAGLRTAEALRRQGYEGVISLLGAEDHQPYNRPPLSKELLAGTWEAERTPLRPADKLAELDLDLRLGQAATAFDAATGTLTLADGSTVTGDAVVLATGSTARTWPGPAPAAGVHVVRTLDDSLALRADFEAGLGPVVVIGAGFIGSEVAAVARGYGLDVTVVEPLAAPLIRGLGIELGEAAAELHRRHGVEVRCGIGVDAIEGGERPTAVRLTDGSTIPVGTVVVGIGARPATEWLVGSGLTIDDGIVCDEHLAAVGAEGVWAAGDVCRWQHPTYGETVRFEHWTTAVDHAPAVAADILRDGGERVPHAPVPYVWSDLHGVRIQIAGRAGADDRLEVLQGAVADDKFVAVRTADDLVTGVIAFASMRSFVQLQMRLGSGPLTVDEARTILS